MIENGKSFDFQPSKLKLIYFTQKQKNENKNYLTRVRSMSESVSEAPKIMCPYPSLLRTRTRTRTHVRSRVRVGPSLSWIINMSFYLQPSGRIIGPPGLDHLKTGVYLELSVQNRFSETSSLSGQSKHTRTYVLVWCASDACPVRRVLNFPV